jgi:hypothetical protein
VVGGPDVPGIGISGGAGPGGGTGTSGPTGGTLLLLTMPSLTATKG